MKLRNIPFDGAFRTKHKYALRGTVEKCDTFAVVGWYRRRDGKEIVKCLALNYRNPQLMYFPMDKEVERIDKSNILTT